MSLSDYTKIRNERGALFDPILRFHEQHGASIGEIITGYRPKDKKNDGCGVFIRYNIYNRRRKEFVPKENESRVVPGGEKLSDKDLSREGIKEFLETMIGRILGKDLAIAYSKRRPLMEMGLDSADILEFGEQIRCRYDINLEPSFFFQYNTVERIQSYLVERVGHSNNSSISNGKVEQNSRTGPPTRRLLKSSSRSEKSSNTRSPKAVAIIGIACRLPGNISTPEELWELLKSGHDVIRELPQDRWQWPIEIDPTGQHKGIDQGGFLESIDRFDASFFRLLPKEVELMDPQQRILLELSWETMEAAGYCPKQLAKSNTGVFIGASGSDYGRLLDQSSLPVDARFATGSSMAVLANRISYFYDLHGPSLLIDTACSSSLVAVHNAVQSIRSGESSLALVGGVNVICHPSNSIAYYKSGMLARDGKCKTFDQKADGYVRAEGAIMLLLKPMENAVADQDPIHAVIKGTSCSHGGQAGGLTVPNPEEQTQLIQESWRNAKIAPESVSYIETHGTGTSLGDPIEINGLKTAFFSFCEQDQNKMQGVAIPKSKIKNFSGCGLGSIKSNLGHLEAAAGIAGLLKVVLSLRHHEMPATLNFGKLNHHITLTDSPFHIVDHHQPWTLAAHQQLRTAGVSSFGSGGTNAHVVVHEFSDEVPGRFCQFQPYVIVLSAKTAERLQVYAGRLLSHLNSQKEEKISLASLAYTSQRREAMEERALFFVEEVSELKDNLERLARGETQIKTVYRGNVNENADLTDLLCEDLEMKRVVDGWITSGEHKKIARLWVRGMEIDWGFLYKQGEKQSTVTRGSCAKLVELPPYPFMKTRYWIPKSNVSDSLHIPDPKRNGEAVKPATKAKIWEMRPEWNSRVIKENLPERFIINDSQLLVLYDLDKKSEMVLKSLLSEKRYLAISRINNPNDGRAWIAAYWDTIQSFRSALNVHRPTQCILLTNSNQSFAEMIYSTLQSVQREMDLSVQWGAWNGDISYKNESLVRPILTKMLDSENRSSEQRFMVNARQLICEEKRWKYRGFSFGKKNQKTKFGGVYWITGGHGGLGKIIANYLARKYYATVILSGRTDHEDSESAKYEFDHSTKHNGSIHYRIADCTDRKAMASLAVWIEKTHGPLTGVIHAAGVIRDRRIHFKSEDDVYAVMLPKIEGAMILDEVTQGCTLDFFMLFSSLMAVIGNSGQTDYAAANQFLRHFSNRRQKQAERGERSGTSIVIHWPYWKNGGMQLNTDQIESFRQFLGMQPLPTDDGLTVLDYLISECGKETCVFYGSNPSTDHAKVEIHRDKSTFERDDKSPVKSSKSNTGSTEIQQEVKKIIAKLTKLDIGELDIHTHFSDLGFDSILLQSLANEINSRYKINLKLVDYLNRPSISGVSEFIRAKVPLLAAQETKEDTNTITPEQIIQPISSKPQGYRGTDTSDIAIIGLNLQVPGMESLDDFWATLIADRCPITPYPKDRWERMPKDFTANKRREDYPGNYLKDILKFDHRLFTISPREAMLMDPQQRLLLQSVWQAIENAGYRRTDFAKRRTSFFLAINAVDYTQVARYDDCVDEFSGGGVTRYIAANRISHFFNLHGMSETIDTACSSFFVALERGFDCLKKGVSEQAIVAGVQLNLLPIGFDVLREQGLLSAQDRTLPFDQKADGFVRGEGVGAVILKPLKQALQDHDHVYAVLKGVGIWHAGKALGLTTPNAAAHREAMKQALVCSSVAVDRIAYLEAHGTGLPLGDASEIDAFIQVFKSQNRDREKKCILSAIKSSLCHLEAASGMAVLTKSILALQKGEVPGIPGFKNIHQEINFDSDYFRISDKPQNLPKSMNSDGEILPVCVGLNSYGLGGVSAFVVLEEYIGNGQTGQKIETQSPELFVLSAGSKNALTAYLNKIARFLSRKRGEILSVNFRDLIAVFQLNREPMSYRLAIAVYSLDDMLTKITRVQEGLDVEGYFTPASVDPKPVITRDELKRFVDQKDWTEVAKAWVSGETIPWPIRDYSRYPFPEYPFNLEKEFWISQKKNNGQVDDNYQCLLLAD